MDQETKEYTLKRPVTVGERTCTELRFRRPKLKDFIAVGSSPLETAEALSKLISSITGEPQLIIDQLDVEDSAYVKIEAERAYSTYFFATTYELNPTPPPKEKAEATTTTNTSPSVKSATE